LTGKGSAVFSLYHTPGIWKRNEFYQ